MPAISVIGRWKKLLKAFVQLNSGEVPPRTHNLPTLAELTGLKMSERQVKFLLRLNPHYIGTRYPDDLVAFYKQYTTGYASKLFAETKELFIWVRDCLIQKR